MNVKVHYSELAYKKISIKRRTSLIKNIMNPCSTCFFLKKRRSIMKPDMLDWGVFKSNIHGPWNDP